MTDASRVVVWSADYKPFGEATVTISMVANNLRFPGQYYDSETSLHYNYFRDYDTSIGRYKQADPIGTRRGTNHLYIYVDSNPIIYEDPKGLTIDEGRKNLNILAQRLLDKGYTPEQVVNMLRGLSGSLEYDPAQATTMAAVIFPVVVKACFVAGAAIGGYWAGGKINSIPVYGTKQTVSEWWSDFIWDATHPSK